MEAFLYAVIATLALTLSCLLAAFVLKWLIYLFTQKALSKSAVAILFSAIVAALFAIVYLNLPGDLSAIIYIIPATFSLIIAIIVFTLTILINIFKIAAFVDQKYRERFGKNNRHHDS